MLEVLVDGVVVEHREVPPPADDARIEIAFAGGGAALATADVGVWDFAHVLAVTVSRQGELYRFDTTVRHRDEGWEHYSDLWRVVGDGVENGERVLLHPHDDEQPFTRSQSGVRAEGVVTVESRDSLHGWGGSTIRVDLDALTNDQIRIELRFAGAP